MTRITVLRNTTNKPVGKNYEVTELAYKTEDGKTKGMKIFGFGPQKENQIVAAKAQSGDVLEAQFRQNDKGYWEFSELKTTGEKAAVASEAGATHSAGGTTRSGGNWETSDERAKRQVMIVRQSSLSTAVAYLEAAKVKPNIDDVIGAARSFEAYVLGTKDPNVKQQSGDVE